MKFWFVAISVCCSILSYAQTDYVIGEIVISGNKRTKNYIIERELPFKTGDSVALPELVSQFETARQQLINTRLFNEAVVALKSFRGHVVDVLIEVKERWYLFPLPYLKPVDRNLSEWAKQGYGTDRLNYGFKLTQYNFSGRNDKLRFWLVTGYTKQVQFQYEQPYADKKLKQGYKIGFSYSSNKEINYGTFNNQQQFIDTLGNGLKRWTGFLEYDYRPGLRTFHAVRLGFTRMEIPETILKLNPTYYNDGINKINIPELSYTISHFNLDYIPFPLKGWSGEASILKRGISAHTNMWQLSAKYNRAIPLGKKYYFNWQTMGILRLPFKQPYYNSQLFGYGEMYLRGLENYVIDGAGGILSRQSFRKEMLTFNLPFIGTRSHDKIPFRIYARTFGDFGYGLNKSTPHNSLTNRMLFTTGVGLDVVTFYDFVFRFDYSFNQLGQNGLFLHLKNEF